MVGFAGWITTQILSDTREIGYAYDANGNVTGITQPGKPQHQFAYTPMDLESTYTPPDAGFTPTETQYAYNLDRQLTTVTRPDGQTLQLGYEPTGGRLSTLTLPGSQVTTYAYGATAGTLSSITAPGSTLSYTYDGSLLKQAMWSGTVAGTVSRNYDNNFRITSQSVNGANTMSFGYDNDSLLTSAGALSITRSPQNGLVLLANDFLVALLQALPSRIALTISTQIDKELSGQSTASVHWSPATRIRTTGSA